MHDVSLRQGLPFTCIEHWSPSHQHRLVLCSCPGSAVGCSIELCPGCTGYKWGSPKPLWMWVNSYHLDFGPGTGAWPPFIYDTGTGQKSPQLTFLVLICYCTFYLWWIYVADSVHLQPHKTGEDRNDKLCSRCFTSGASRKAKNLSLSYKIFKSRDVT